MAIERQIIIDVDSNKAEKNLDGVIKQFDTLGKEAVSSIKNIEKGVDNTEKTTKSLAQGFKGVGVAIKSDGISLVLEAFNILKIYFNLIKLLPINLVLLLNRCLLRLMISLTT